MGKFHLNRVIAFCAIVLLSINQSSLIAAESNSELLPDDATAPNVPMASNLSITPAAPILAPSTPPINYLKYIPKAFLSMTQSSPLDLELDSELLLGDVISPTLHLPKFEEFMFTPSVERYSPELADNTGNQRGGAEESPKNEDNPYDSPYWYFDYTQKIRATIVKVVTEHYDYGSNILDRYDRRFRQFWLNIRARSLMDITTVDVDQLDTKYAQLPKYVDEGGKEDGSEKRRSFQEIYEGLDQTQGALESMAHHRAFYHEVLEELHVSLRSKEPHIIS